MRFFRLCLALLALLIPSLLVAQDPAERDWSEALSNDAQALHADIAANHPGPVNTEDSGFAMHNDAQLALALDRAKTAKSYGDYFFALREYVSSFNDGHMGFGAYGNTPNNFQWPGFFTNYDPAGQIAVVEISEGSPVPLDAKLIGCDGKTADQFAAATLGPIWGRWELESQRRQWGDSLFLDEGSRYISRAKKCTFAVGTENREVELNWKPISIKEYFERSRKFNSNTKRQFETRTLADGTYWFSMPSFNGNPQSDAGKALPNMIATMREDRIKLASAPAIILDLRGNGGGSSDWSRQMAVELWGAAAIKKLPPRNIQVDWRTSKANLAAIEESYKERSPSSNMSYEMREWYETTIAGLRAAVARGDQLWRHPDTKPTKTRTTTESQRLPKMPPLPPVYFVTDGSCGSACLDAVDLWLALGAVHVGRTTSADTLYMELRRLALPSGITGVSMPMKVYRGRSRGSNVPVVPKYKFDGDINDTAALEAWLAKLQQTGR